MKLNLGTLTRLAARAQPVVPRAARQPVGAVPAPGQVLALAPEQGVVAAAPIQHVGGGIAPDAVGAIVADPVRGEAEQRKILDPGGFDRVSASTIFSPPRTA